MVGGLDHFTSQPFILIMMYTLTKLCLYQMRAHTEYRGGEWSEVVLISHGTILSSGESCSVPTVTSATTTVTVAVPELSSGSLHVPVLIAVGVVLGAIVLISLSILVVVCSRIHRRKTQLKHVLKRQVRPPVRNTGRRVKSL